MGSGSTMWWPRKVIRTYPALSLALSKGVSHTTPTDSHGCYTSSQSEYNSRFTRTQHLDHGSASPECSRRPSAPALALDSNGTRSARGYDAGSSRSASSHELAGWGGSADES